MIKYLHEYPSDFERDLNTQLMTKASDKSLVEYVIDSWKSLCIIENIQFLDYEYTEKESDIDINKYIFKREKKKKKNEKRDYKFINDDRCGLLTVRMKISAPENDPSSGKTIMREKIIKKSMLVPLQDENGSFYIKGKSYYLILKRKNHKK